MRAEADLEKERLENQRRKSLLSEAEDQVTSG